MTLHVLSTRSAAGAPGPGTELAPSALVKAGLLEALRASGADVQTVDDATDVVFPYRADHEHPSGRNVRGVAAAAAFTAEGVVSALTNGSALLLGGDCTLIAGSLAGARRALGRPVGVVYLDAHADLNTPETSPSGFLCGMALALALGHGPAEVTAAGGARGVVEPEHVALLGYREVDPGERPLLESLGLALPAEAARSMGMRGVAARALDEIANDGGPLWVHVDVDVLDPGLMTAKHSLTPGAGLRWEELAELLAALAASGRLVGMQVAEFFPPGDPDGRQARRLIETLVRGGVGG